ncbi:hypothetical protein XPR_2104 [Xanthomonas arboricola pv. pruni MAFF 301420]|uniref:Uncharacterized protein n=1 Tax=Xanthomonas arboricola pv. pruni MAFF 301420 TaxID=1418095 RepID=W4SHQ4_9XANT|nr:hypothetical protein XPR_2104 [Xanthomonas arboricola pv. pruni MAFF 301420]GAE60633.1 hypothetical protein XPN_2539 [Xanthomonas arboricola pv. pruni MAFF 301427]
MDHRAFQVLAFGDADAAVVEHRAGAAAGGEQLVAQRVEDHRVGGLAVFHQRDRYAVMREAAQIVAGAVQRIDDPGVAATLATLHAAFFAEHGVLGVAALEFLDDDLLGIGIDFAGVVHAAFLHHVERIELVDTAQQHIAGEAGGFDHDGDGGFLHG